MATPKATFGIDTSDGSRLSPGSTARRRAVSNALDPAGARRKRDQTGSVTAAKSAFPLIFWIWRESGCGPEVGLVHKGLGGGERVQVRATARWRSDDDAKRL
jgi:hypothetical protein